MAVLVERLRLAADETPVPLDTGGDKELDRNRPLPSQERRVQFLRAVHRDLVGPMRVLERSDVVLEGAQGLLPEGGAATLVCTEHRAVHLVPDSNRADLEPGVVETVQQHLCHLIGLHVARQGGEPLVDERLPDAVIRLLKSGDGLVVLDVLGLEGLDLVAQRAVGRIASAPCFE